ncbi:hypothetical protein WN48_02641 [Eufriesea mexicana]|uniref:Uncharacterized protein n=1 Tax=Eufriesea mexicana TaxID=516756 RepID=A0A310SNM3_9HYME|nr:hypothetical protein WN48_02641 [Eufriesea mexicana]
MKEKRKAKDSSRIREETSGSLCDLVRYSYPSNRLPKDGRGVSEYDRHRYGRKYRGR